MSVQSIDHIVLTTRDLDKCLAFYTGALGMTLERFGAVEVVPARRVI